jgi:hypothetical protein
MHSPERTGVQGRAAMHSVRMVCRPPLEPPLHPRTPHLHPTLASIQRQTCAGTL